MSYPNILIVSYINNYKKLSKKLIWAHDNIDLNLSIHEVVSCFVEAYDISYNNYTACVLCNQHYGGSF